jgi:hypothetical protein
MVDLKLFNSLENAFYVVYSKGTMEFCCDSKEHCEGWVTIFNKLLNDFYETIKSPRKINQ